MCFKHFPIVYCRCAGLEPGKQEATDRFSNFHRKRKAEETWFYLKNEMFRFFRAASVPSRVHKFKCHTWKFLHFQHTQIRVNGAWRLGRVSVIFTPTLFISFSFVYTSSEKSFPSVLEKRKQNIENCFNLGTNGCCWSARCCGAWR